MPEQPRKPDTMEDKTQKQILDIIVGKDDVSWKAIIFGLIETEQMDPWDINISLIAQRFIDMLKKLQEMDFRIGGKVVLASAVLLKLKAEKLRDEELMALERFIQTAEEPIDLGLDELQDAPVEPFERPQLVPRTPQPRKRKVSVYDLVEALEKALEHDANRPVYQPPKTLDTINPPEHHIDISVIIREVYDHIYGHYEVKKNDDQLMFHHIARSTDRQDMVMTFIPLLHLENARKVEMEQPEHFGPINIHLLDRTPPAYAAKDTQTRIKEEPLPAQELQVTLAPKETGKSKPAKKEQKKMAKSKQLPLTTPPVVEKPATAEQKKPAKKKK